MDSVIKFILSLNINILLVLIYLTILVLAGALATQSVITDKKIDKIYNELINKGE